MSDEPQRSPEALRMDQLAEFYREASTAQFRRAYQRGVISLDGEVNFTMFEHNASERLVYYALTALPDVALDPFLASCFQRNCFWYDLRRRADRAETLCRYIAELSSGIGISGIVQLLLGVARRAQRGEETILYMLLGAVHDAIERLPPAAVALPLNVHVGLANRSPYEALRGEYFRAVANLDFHQMPLHRILVEKLDEMCAPRGAPNRE